MRPPRTRRRRAHSQPGRTRRPPAPAAAADWPRGGGSQPRPPRPAPTPSPAFKLAAPARLNFAPGPEARTASAPAAPLGTREAGHCRPAPALHARPGRLPRGGPASPGLRARAQGGLSRAAARARAGWRAGGWWAAPLASPARPPRCPRGNRPSRPLGVRVVRRQVAGIANEKKHAGSGFQIPATRGTCGCRPATC